MTLRRKNRGFTLIEALAAVLLVSIVLPVAMRGFSLAALVADEAKHREEAAVLAHSKMSELLATGGWQTGALSGDFAPEHPEYKWKAELNNWDTSTLQKLDLHVNWNSAGRDQVLTISTLFDTVAN
jgi:general secretion pathway protein I